MSTKLEDVIPSKTELTVHSGINEGLKGVVIGVDYDKELITLDIKSVVGLRVYNYKILDVVKS